MSRGYLNSLSFPAEDVERALELLSELRQGIAHLMRTRVIAPQVMCALRASQLPLSPDYMTLAHAAKTARAPFRDTILFFLTALDQRSPAHSALTPQDQDEAQPSIVNDADCQFDPEAATVLVACALDGGVLLSLGSSERWRSAQVSIVMMTASAESERQAVLTNVHDVLTADQAARARAAAIARHRFENWSHLAGDARRAAQLDSWFNECRTRPGLEQLVMRTVASGFAQAWRADGDLVKKLNFEASVTIFELRAWFNGSNNVRLLFGRDPRGVIAFGYGGIKTSPDWYDHAIPRAARFISGS